MHLPSPIKAILDLIYPSICVGCDQHMALGEDHFCMGCLTKMPYTRMEEEADNAFEKHFWGRVPIEAGMALSYFIKDGILQRAMYAMKYNHMPTVGRTLGRSLGMRMLDHDVFSTCDCIVPVPLHERKRRKRGYNQCDFIAQGISDILGIPVVTRAVVRTKANTSQTRKSRIQRMKNVEQLFQVRRGVDLPYQHYLLIDDMMTSGATLDACAQALLAHQKCKISMATLGVGAPV